MKKLAVIGMLAAMSTHAAFAATWNTSLNNATGYVFVLNKTENISPPKTACTNSLGGKSAPCLSAVANRGTQYVAMDTPNWLTLNYNVCTSLTNSGTCNGYVTNFTINVNSDSTSFTESKGLLAMQWDFASSSYRVVANPPVNPPVPAPSAYNAIPWRGVNLAGFEFGGGTQDTMPPPSYFPTVNDGIYFIKLGANTVRVPIEWAYLQTNLNSPIGGNLYDASIQNLITTLTASGVKVILDVHDYMRYGGSNPNAPLIGKEGSAATVQSFANLWIYLASQYKNNPHVIFDLMNEPYADASGYPNATDVVSIYNQVIAAIRSTGAQNKILLEGTEWSGLHSWEKSGNAAAFARGKIVDSASNFAINVHQYLDGATDYSGSNNACDEPAKFLNNIHANDFAVWLRNNGYQAVITEFGGQAPNAINDPNGYCIQDLATLVNYMHSNSDIFLGWTAWAGGTAWNLLASPYHMSLQPTTSTPTKQMETLGQFLTPL